MKSDQSVPVAVVSRPKAKYPELAPFDPPNPIYEMVEAVLRDLGFDRARSGTPDWNPLGDLIAPGDRVVLKPNFVASKNFHQPLHGEKLLCSSTPGSVLRPLLDYALRATGPTGQVTIVDTPVEGCNVNEVLRGLGIDQLIAYYRERGHSVEFLDLRYFQIVPRMVLDDVRRHGRSYNLGMLVRESLPGDPLGYRVVDLGSRSRFAAVEQRSDRYRFHRSHQHTPRPHHSGGKHEYSIPRTVLAADCILNLAKCKTHKKSGVTLACKSVIGLTNEKYWLPHYTAGTPAEDGDEFPFWPPLAVRMENQLQRFPMPLGHSLVARAPRLHDPQNGMVRGYILEGSWEGNDTIWRTILDLGEIVLHTGKDGVLRDTPQRRYLTLIDGIIGGEGEGPLASTPRHAGLLIGSQDPVLADLVTTRLMGFDPSRVKTITEGLRRPILPSSKETALVVSMNGVPPSGAFKPPSTWPSLLRQPSEAGQ